MRAARLHGVRDLRLEEVEIPHPGPGEVAIEVDSVGVCASDVHYYLHGSIGGLQAKDGLILGHEFAGRIVEIGSEFRVPGSMPGRSDSKTLNLEPETRNLKLGTRVTAEPVRPCGDCRECLRGDYHLCRKMLFFGTPPTDGALRDRVVCPAEWVFPLPEEMTTAEGAMMEPLAVGVFTAELARMSGGETAAVVGCGAIGLSVLQALKAMGAGAVYAEDPIPEREQLAVELGAEPTPCPPHSVDLAAECAGTLEAVHRALETVRPGGTVLVVGIPDDDTMAFSASVARRKGLTLQFARRYRHCFPRSLHWTAEGQIRVAPYLTHRFPLARTAEAFDLAAQPQNGVIRAWIDLTEGR